MHKNVLFLSKNCKNRPPPSLRNSTPLVVYIDCCCFKLFRTKIFSTILSFLRYGKSEDRFSPL